MKLSQVFLAILLLLVQALLKAHADSEIVPMDLEPSMDLEPRAHFSSGTRSLFLTWAILSTIIFSSGAVGMYLRRNYQPVKSRDTFLITMTNAGFIFSTLLRCLLVVIPDVPCIFDAWESAFSVGIINGIYLLRSWKMFFKFELAHERSSLHGREKEERKSGPEAMQSQLNSGMRSHFIRRQAWFSRHRFLISKKFTIAFSLILQLWFLGPMIILTITNTWTDHGGFVGSDLCDFSQRGHPLITMTIVSGIILLALLIILALKLRQTFDAFGIKRELTTVFCFIITSWLMSVMITGSKTFGAGFWKFESFEIARKLVPLVWFLPSFFMTSIQPIYKSFVERSEHASTRQDTHDIRTLQGVLHHPEGFVCLEKYLVGCFCVESILFWRDIEHFKSFLQDSMVYATHEGIKVLPNLNAIIDQANEIADTYIYEDSTMQVNISADQRHQCEETLRLINTKYLGASGSVHSRMSSIALSTNAISIGLQHKDGAVKSAGRASLSNTTDSIDGDSVNEPGHAKTSNGKNSDAGAGGTNETPQDEDYIDPDFFQHYYDIVLLFEVAHTEVFELMRTDIFQRFIETSEFSEFVQRIERQAAAQQELQELHII